MAKKNDRLKLVRHNKKMPRWKKAFRFLFRLILLLGLVLLLKHGEAYFRVNEITVEGVESIQPGAILSSGNLKPGMSILFLKENSIADAIISDHPQIKSVEITRNLPDSLVVAVTERSLAAYVITPDGYWLIDSETFCFGYTTEPAVGYPVISGIDGSLVTPGAPLGCSAKRETLHSFFQKWSLEDLPEIETINYADSYNLIVGLAGGWELWLGDAKEMGHKILLVKESMPYIAEGSQARLDVRSGKRLVVSSSSIINEREVDP